MRADYYQVLGVGRKATLKEIEEAYMEKKERLDKEKTTHKWILKENLLNLEEELKSLKDKNPKQYNSIKSRKEKEFELLRNANVKILEQSSKSLAAAEQVLSNEKAKSIYEKT